jgi:hypothetical protein
MGILSDLDALAAANAAHLAAAAAGAAALEALSPALGLAIGADDTVAVTSLAAELSTAVAANP